MLIPHTYIREQFAFLFGRNQHLLLDPKDPFCLNMSKDRTLIWNEEEKKWEMTEEGKRILLGEL